MIRRDVLRMLSGAFVWASSARFTVGDMHDSPTQKLVRTCLWRWLRGTGLERCSLIRESEGWRLQGTILTLSDGLPAEVRYHIHCDSAWHTRNASLTLSVEGTQSELEMVVQEGRWYANGSEVLAIRGCIDIDLSWSPSTNTLPIRRLNLPVRGSSGSLSAAWVRFPELRIEPLEQQYERLSDRRYRYTSRKGSFIAEIEVDDQGLVVDYQDAWRRISTEQDPR